jgi:hypothetical protein
MKRIKAIWSGAVAAILLSSIASGAVFPGTGTGAIPGPTHGEEGPANYGLPLIISFDVNDLTGNIQDISVSITMNHPYIGDLDVFLTSPPNAGSNSFTLFSGVGALSFYGHYSYAQLDGTYQFSDSAPWNLWSACGDAENYWISNSLVPLSSGAYRTSRPGGDALGGTLTTFHMDSGFIGLTPSQANGTWTLTVRDGATGDSGFVTAAALTIVVPPRGADLVEQFVPCTGPSSGGRWKSHGEYVSAVGNVVRELLSGGALTEQEAEDIVEAAAKSDCGKK